MSSLSPFERPTKMGRFTFISHLINRMKFYVISKPHSHVKYDNYQMQAILALYAGYLFLRKLVLQIKKIN